MWIDRAEMGEGGAHINHAKDASLASLTSLPHPSFKLGFL